MDRWVPHSQSLGGRHVVAMAGVLLVDGRAHAVDGTSRVEVTAESPPVVRLLLLLGLAAVAIPVVQALQLGGVVEAPWLVAVPTASGVFATLRLLTAGTRYAVVLCRGAQRRHLLASEDVESAKAVELLVREAVALADAAAPRCGVVPAGLAGCEPASAAAALETGTCAWSRGCTASSQEADHATDVPGGGSAGDGGGERRVCREADRDDG